MGISGSVLIYSLAKLGICVSGSSKKKKNTFQINMKLILIQNFLCNIYFTNFNFFFVLFYNNIVVNLH